ncbi:MAG TPA: hypothetical protein VIE17_01495 [Methylophilaceae bacterium]|jgi:hypothetical protein
MENYQVWFLRRNGELIGSFPDALLAQHIVLGRVHEGDEVSIDAHYWVKPEEVEALQQVVDNLIGVGTGDISDDPEWRSDRLKAAMRWLDERKAPDRRSVEDEAAAARWAAMRGSKERRLTPESPEILEYRKNRAVIEASLRRPRRNYTPAILAVIVIILGIMIYAVMSGTVVSPFHIDWDSLRRK